MYDRTQGAPVESLNSIRNNPKWGDERNFTLCRLAEDPGSKYVNAVSASDGDAVEEIMYLDNASARPTAGVVNTRLEFVVDATATDDPGVQVAFTGTRQSRGTEQTRVGWLRSELENSLALSARSGVGDDDDRAGEHNIWGE
ncbi:hypothetical protein [Williamsia sp. DF01-3]|uniref:hypothetical protein n=1 Tax=Williamsia sp. DF01-3 TaxID=2934157 RepID=UPI001FF20129|nr:hypothetical protein [Williamsia sp. DF01-3]MCK0517101.1 hypothetical protein [Williamsia sp. DF01-3]